MISRLAINYFDILIMERNLHVFADPVNHCFQECHCFQEGMLDLVRPIGQVSLLNAA